MRERRPGVWELRAFLGRGADGRPRQVSKTFHGGKREARKALAALEVEANAGKHGRPDTAATTVAALLDRHLDNLERLGRAPTTTRTYRGYVKQLIVPALGSKRVRNLTAYDLDLFYSRLAAGGRSSATIRQVHAIISGALKQAVKWDMVPSNVARAASPPTVPRAEVRVPTAAEVKLILLEAERRDPMLGRLLMLGALTGARRGELCALRWSDVDLDAGTLRIAHSVMQVGRRVEVKDTKSHQVRVIALDNAGVALLRLHREDVDARAAATGAALAADAFLFSDRSLDGTVMVEPDWLTRRFTSIVEALGLDGLTLHGLRHFMATQLAARGDVSARTLAGRLGHAASVTLKVYAAYFPAADVEAARHMGELLTGTTATART